MTPHKALKLAAINTSILIAILSLTDFVAGKYRLNSPALDIPGSIVGERIVYTTAHKSPKWKWSFLTYSRDSKGYRPYDTNQAAKGLILTIGGSTTDQRYIDDSMTWQRVLEANTGRSVLNGGIDGQSTYGHIISLRRWHKYTLEKKDVKDIIFYIGVNDVQLSRLPISSEGTNYDSPKAIRKVHSYLSRRSFLYRKLKELKLRIKNLAGAELSSPDGTVTMGHGIINPSFLNKPIANTPQTLTSREGKVYTNLFKELLSESKTIFPNASIHIVQQQDPKCLIEQERTYIRVSDSQVPRIEEYCSRLASVYKLQQEELRETKMEKISLTKMYQDNPVPDSGFYDGIHTNADCSYAIGTYLANKLSL